MLKRSKEIASQCSGNWYEDPSWVFGDLCSTRLDEHCSCIFGTLTVFNVIWAFLMSSNWNNREWIYKQIDSQLSVQFVFYSRLWCFCICVFIYQRRSCWYASHVQDISYILKCTSYLQWFFPIAVLSLWNPIPSSWLWRVQEETV